jgi:hypothetical protein
MEVNALFANAKTIKPAARAFADFLLRELRAAKDGPGQGNAVTARHSTFRCRVGERSEILEDV